MVLVVLHRLFHFLLGHYCPLLIAAREHLNLNIALVSLDLSEENDVRFLEKLNLLEDDLLDALDLVLIVNLDGPHLVRVVRLLGLLFILFVGLDVGLVLLLTSVLDGLLFVLVGLLYLVLVVLLLVGFRILLGLALVLFVVVLELLDVGNVDIVEVLSLVIVLLVPVLDNHYLHHLDFPRLLGRRRFRQSARSIFRLLHLRNRHLVSRRLRGRSMWRFLHYRRLVLAWTSVHRLLDHSLMRHSVRQTSVVQHVSLGLAHSVIRRHSRMTALLAAHHGTMHAVHLPMHSAHTHGMVAVGSGLD